MLAQVPSSLLAYFPINNPNPVKRKLMIEKISNDRKIFEVIAFNPSPVEKASMDTPIANKNIPKIFRLTVSSSFKNNSYNIWPAINNKMIPNNKLLLIWNVFTKFVPMIIPINGIKKCMIPTIIDNVILCFIVRFIVPSPKEREKVSMLKATAIMKILTISIIRKPPITLYGGGDISLQILF